MRAVLGMQSPHGCPLPSNYGGMEKKKARPRPRFVRRITAERTARSCSAGYFGAVVGAGAGAAAAGAAAATGVCLAFIASSRILMPSCDAATDLASDSFARSRLWNDAPLTAVHHSQLACASPCF